MKLAALRQVPLKMHVLTRVHRVRRRVRDVAFGRPDAVTTREDLARRYLAGAAGIEIGALHRPLRLPPGSTVRYVDRLPLDELRVRYPHYRRHWAVTPDIIDDATTLATIPDASQDFVVANHVLEHMEDPIGALRSWMRVLRPGGVALLAVPDKRKTFDAQRPSTTLEHLQRDAREGPGWSRSQHYEEYARLAEQVAPDEVAARARELERDRVDIHFHVWTQAELVGLLLALPNAEGLPYELELAQANDIETLLVLRRV